MVKEYQYTSIKRILDDLMEHPLLRDVTLEQVVRYTIRFIALHGYPKLYQDKIDEVEIHEFRGMLPCDLVSIIQVKDAATGICLRSMTDTFTKGLRKKDVFDGHNEYSRQNGLDRLDRPIDITRAYIPPMKAVDEEPSFKTQGRVIFTSFSEGCVEIAYKSIPVDEDNFPMLIDNENFIAALEAYIKVQVFTIKFDTGKLNANILQNAQTDYAWKSAELMDEFTIPSTSEMESITRFINTTIVPMRAFDNGYRDLGNREYLRRH